MPAPLFVSCSTRFPINALIQYARMRHLSPETAKETHGKALRLVARFHGHEELIEEAIELAAARAGSVYDTLYLVLARRHAAMLLTADSALAASARKLRIRLPS